MGQNPRSSMLALPSIGEKELKRSDGTPYVQLLDAGDTKCLPVVTARVNPALNAPHGSVSW